MPGTRRAALVTLAATALAVSLAACTGAQDVTGVWTAPDGTSAFINEGGDCRGVYWTQGQSLDIGGPMTCAYSDGSLVVSQPPNQITYDVTFDGDTMTLTAGDTEVTFTRG